MKPIYKEKYPHLFEPMYVGQKKNIVFKNRIFQAPVGERATGGGADNGRINLVGVDFWTSIARSGFAAFTLPMEVPREGSHAGVFNLDEKEHNYMNMHLMQRSIHAYKTKSFAELIHGGPCMIRTDIPLLGADNRIYNGRQVKSMDYKDMEEVTELFVKESRLAKRAGIDEFGGSVENRCRFPLMILKAVREAIGDEMLIELRLNGNDDYPGGILPADAAEQVLIFQDYADLIHITCGTRLDVTSRTTQTPTSFFPGAHNAYASEYIKKTVNPKIPIGTVGGVYSAAIAEDILAKGQADYVLTARSAIADPDFLIKVKEGREEDIRPCLKCDLCLDHGRRKSKISGKELVMASDVSFDRRCAVNPLGMQGATKRRFPAPSRIKNIAVIGGGVAGMQAAISAADRGHKVVLYEKTDKLGGQALLSDVLSFKKEMKLFHEYLERQVKKHKNIVVMMNTTATAQMMDDLNPDAVIVAVGAEQIVPKIPGVENAMMSFDVFGHEDKVGHKVVIIGGGDIGVEVAIHLNSLGHECTVVEMAHYIAPNAQLTNRMSYLSKIEEEKIETMIDTTCVEITDKGAYVESAEGKKFLEADTVIICVGTKPLIAERDQFIDTAFDVINVGDCVKASSIVHAVHTGFDAGLIL